MPWLLFIGVGFILAAAKLAGGSTTKPAVATPIPPVKKLPKPAAKLGRYLVQVMGKDGKTLEESYDGDNQQQAKEIFAQWQKAKVTSVFWDRHISELMPILAYNPSGGVFDPRGV